MSDKFDESQELLNLVSQILNAVPKEDFAKAALDGARRSTFSILFVNTKPREYGGYCSKVEEAVAFKTGLQFMVKIWREEFDKLDDTRRCRLLIHELAHISFTDDKPTIFDHEINRFGDFCELPNHDAFSMRIYENIKDQIKMPTFTKPKKRGVGASFKWVKGPRKKEIPNNLPGEGHSMEAQA